MVGNVCAGFGPRLPAYVWLYWLTSRARSLLLSPRLPRLSVTPGSGNVLTPLPVRSTPGISGWNGLRLMYDEIAEIWNFQGKSTRAETFSTLRGPCGP